MQFSRSFKRTAALVVASALFTAAPALFGQNPQEKADTAAVVNANSQFAFDLYRNINAVKGTSGQNIFISPYSISTALAMTYVGSHGKTEKQMAATLHFSLPMDRLENGFSTLLGETKATPAKKYRLEVANALWGQQDYHFDPAFTSAVSRYFDGGFNTVNFISPGAREDSRQKINRWVENKTSGKIKDLIGREDIDDTTRLILTNAIYFKGDWASKFKKELTRNEPFHTAPSQTVPVPMMRQMGVFPFMENDELQMIELPYAGDDLSMIILLPAGDVQAFGAGLTPAKLNELRGLLHRREVEVYLPRFRFESRYVLNGPLAALGMPEAFEETVADFSGMTGKIDLYISAVIHQAMIEVNEEGSEAAAATAVIMSTPKSIRREEPPVFRADRPFIFMILHKSTDSILFMGRLSSPPPAAAEAATGK